MTVDDHAGLLEILGRARSLGFVGPGPVEPQLAHALGFVALVRRYAEIEGAEGGRTRNRILDLGSGGGLPGLVVAAACPESQVVLLEAGARRARFLSEAVEELGLSGRAGVLHVRAETAGRDDALRAGFEVVTARSFGPPAVVAECAAPLLRLGGHLIVAEPPAQGPVDEGTPGGGVGGTISSPGTEDRWPPEPLRELGLEPLAAVQEGFSYHILRQAQLCADRYPRRDGVPAKRPLF